MPAKALTKMEKTATYHDKWEMKFERIKKHILLLL